MSIPIDPARAVGGRLAAGDRVDVLFAGEQAVSIIVADAEVLAVDARVAAASASRASPFTVTIAVTARQSQLVAAAVADGEISLARTTGARSARGTAPQSLDRVARRGSDPTAPDERGRADRRARLLARAVGRGAAPPPRRTTAVRGCARSSSNRRSRSTRSTTCSS